jgi:hypothetical protein
MSSGEEEEEGGGGSVAAVVVVASSAARPPAWSRNSRTVSWVKPTASPPPLLRLLRRVRVTSASPLHELTTKRSRSLAV